MKIQNKHQSRTNKDTHWSKSDEKTYKKAKREKERGKTLALEQVKQELGI